MGGTLLRVEIDDEALAEAVDAQAYYAALRADLAADFATALDRAIARIASHPLTWPPYTANTRRYLMDRFPYAVIYRINGDVLHILAVAHQHRRPGYWTRRI